MPIPLKIEGAVLRVRKAGGALVSLIEQDDRQAEHRQVAAKAFYAAMHNLNQELGDYWRAKRDPPSPH